MSRHSQHSRRRLPISDFGFRISDFRRRGYTMAELMIVVIIMIMLVAATLPIAKKVMDDSHVREASRQLNAYFAMAKARAIHTGRPCGLFFDCDDVSWASNAPNVRMVTQMHLAEVPAPYSGSTVEAAGKVMSDGGGGHRLTVTDDISILQSLLTLNEEFQVRFDYKGNWHTFDYTNNGLTFRPPPNPVPAGYVYPPGYLNPSAASVKYQVYRRPQKVGNPLAMPTGTCIDLTYSGSGPANMGFASGLKAMAVMLTPNGGVDKLHFSDGTTSTISTPSNTLFFLVGKIDKVNDPQATNYADIRDSNLADPTSLWVTVGRGNGQVTTSENVPDPTPSVQANLGNYLRSARQIASSREQMKGR
jgi:type II secretory pathway pseudopilin PulG